MNLSGSEATWLPGQIQDKLKSNLQEYLGMRTVVDSASEAKVKQLQRESEGSGRDESTAIELGKISTAKFAIFTKIRRTGNGYTMSVDYTDLTTGVQRATATSKEYRSTEELYGSTGAIDEVTLALASRLGIAMNPVQKQALQYGTAGFSIDDQLKLAKQNEEQYKKLMIQFDEQLRSLSVSNDLNAVENSKKIEAEKALLAEKQQSEQKRLAELAEQQKHAAEDALKEAQRSDELKKERDRLSADASAKAAEVRKLKMEKQSVFGQINVIESKKKALVEIRQGVEARIQELRKQAEKDKADEEDRIRGEAYRTVELKDGTPIQEAVKRRENMIAESNRQRDKTLQEEIARVENSTTKQDAELLAEIRSDQEKIKGIRTVSSMGEELKVSYGSYDGQDKCWTTYLSLYSDGVLLYEYEFLVTYKTVTGKDAVNIASASDAAVRDYADTVDMYNSMLLRGDPILYYEINYTVTAAPDNMPSKYTFDFQTLRIINTVTGKTAQTILLKNTLERTMTPVWEIRTESDIVVAEIRQKQQSEKAQKKLRARSLYSRRYGNGSRGPWSIGVNMGYAKGINNDGFTIQADFITWAWSWLYLGMVAGMEPNPINGGENAPTFLGTIGVNKRIPLGYWWPNLYFDFGIGGIVLKTDGKYSNTTSDDKSEFTTLELRYAVGIDLPLGKIFTVNLQYSLNQIPGYAFTDKFTVGAHLSLFGWHKLFK